MSFNQNFYNHFHGNTFQNAPQLLPPPPPPPAYFLPPQAPWDINAQDADFVKQFELNLQRIEPLKSKTVTISTVRDEVSRLLHMLKKLHDKISTLSENLDELSDEEWDSNVAHIEDCKITIYKIVANLKHLNKDVLQKLLAKRLMKRVRLKRLRSERKKEKEEWIKEMQEKSRKIDEKLQNVQNEILKAKQEEEAKIQADIVLKETLRKMHDAKKLIVKLDALMKLRRARQNTAKGRGESVSEVETDTFNNNIEKLKALWQQRLATYEKEESKLRGELCKEPVEPPSGRQLGPQVADHLRRWRDCLFGGAAPQVDFAGDVEKFISVRSQWDELVASDDEDGSSIPVGWVPPSVDIGTEFDIFV